ncbi:MAG: toll/interleukin-1 receptor domain-containing protein, partial [Candidatus Lokiarchaeota archaeon]|nr:toll/interleukin-1 receptor domain-containing protein [Candidatus Lokiarchaeota archaeon]
VSTFLEKDSMKAKLTDNINIFISYATADSNYFQVSNIANLLTENPDIKKVLYWEEDLKDDIYEYMNKNLAKCDIFLLFCSANSNQSEPVQMEWQAALKIKKKIIPVFINESDIPPLLSTKLGVQFIKNDIKKTTDQIYQLILKKLDF